MKIGESVFRNPEPELQAAVLLAESALLRLESPALQHLQRALRCLCEDPVRPADAVIEIASAVRTAEPLVVFNTELANAPPDELDGKSVHQHITDYIDLAENHPFFPESGAMGWGEAELKVYMGLQMIQWILGQVK